MKVMIVNNDRYLINTLSKGVDNICEAIINSYGINPVIDFDEVRSTDIKKKIQELKKNTNKLAYNMNK
mgnify:CR=1 FL=1|jgi:hypothetical protein